MQALAAQPMTEEALIAQLYQSRGRKRAMMECRYCGRIFHPKTDTSVYCSRACSNQAMALWG
jgi:uncharacterized OB-fold protein